MTKKIIVIIGLLTSFIGFTQENTSSPYSFYGLGDIKFRGTEDARAMGGLSFAGDSISLNLLNPASYSSLKLTSFGVGSTSNFNKISNSEASEKAKRTTLDYIAIGVPVGKFGAAFGLMPYSAVGYKIENTYTDLNSLERNERFTGIGNINRVFIGTGYEFNKNFSIGADIQYNFGTIENEAVEFVSDAIFEDNIQLGSRERNTSNISGLSANLGLLYNKKLNEKINLYSSLTYSPESKLNSTNTRNIATATYNPITGTEFVNDSRDIEVANTKLVIPSKLSLGAGIGETNKWLIGTEVTFQSSSNQNNRFDDVTAASFENSQKYTVGGYYIPKYDSFSNYLNKIVYRAGFRYEKTGLVINNQSINDYGMNFGVGLPVTYSKINIGVEFGKRGTTTNGLIEENYFNLSIGLSLSDKWFRKRKID
ncbi:hypothetical protein [Flavobacterium sp.]|jgi:hypothetical protein|uniref:hypothetical protein n=1 Tax=Flavobacterium sp. TaxID=239 RepID=UPI002A7F46E0|nr:hypothetical protein [Flavobacterium sp.]